MAKKEKKEEFEEQSGFLSEPTGAPQFARQMQNSKRIEPIL